MVGSRKIGISDQELHADGIEEDADPMMVVCDLLGKVESKAVTLSNYAHLLRDDRDDGKRNMEATEEEQQDIEDKEAAMLGQQEFYEGAVEMRRAIAHERFGR